MSEPRESLMQLKQFLWNAPANWNDNDIIKKYTLPNGDTVACTLWNGIFHISGTDICKIMVFRFTSFNREITNMKKFEEGIFSDLRNLKPGSDASLEGPRSPFLDYLFKHQSVRTQKKQKVFHWYSVPHDRLFLDALERDLKREALGLESATIALNPMPLLPTLELAKHQCQATEGIFKSDSYQGLPVALNLRANWVEGDATMLPELPQRKLHPMAPEMTHPTPPQQYQPISSFLLPSHEPFLTNDSSPSFSELATPSPSSDMGTYSPLSGLLNSFSLFDHHAPHSIQLHGDNMPVSPILESSKAVGDSGNTFNCTHSGCSRKFKRVEHLRRHKRTHSQDSTSKKAMNRGVQEILKHQQSGGAVTLPSSPFLPALLHHASSPLLSGLDSIANSPFLQSSSPFLSPILNMNNLSIHSPMLNNSKITSSSYIYGTLASGTASTITPESFATSGLMISQLHPETINMSSFIKDLETPAFSISEALKSAAPSSQHQQLSEGQEHAQEHQFGVDSTFNSTLPSIIEENAFSDFSFGDMLMNVNI